MRAIAIDDEPKALSIIKSYVAKTPFVELKGTFRSSLDALDFLRKHAIDIIFLDINMPDLTGIEFLQSLNSTPMIIFTTAYPEYAVQSYDWDTVGYLLKPIPFQKYLKAVNKADTLFKLKNQEAAKGKKASDSAHILLKSGPQIHRIAVKDILYVEASGNHIYVHTDQQKIIALLSMKELMSMLPPAQFRRVHKSFIISVNHIQLLERHQVKLAGLTIPIGKTYRKEFLQEFRDQLAP